MVAWCGSNLVSTALPLTVIVGELESDKFTGFCVTTFITT